MLVENAREAETVRHIYRRYTEIGLVRSLKEDLDKDGIVSKVRINKYGRSTGGKPLARGALYLLLQNRIYRGEIVHKEISYPGQHDAIVDAGLWSLVQTTLTANRVDRANGARETSMLAGLLYDDACGRMTPSHATKKGRRYRYYISNTLITGTRKRTPHGWRVPANDIERLVEERLVLCLRQPQELHAILESHLTEAADYRRLFVKATEMAKSWINLSTSDRRQIMGGLIERIDLARESVEIRFKGLGFLELLGVGQASDNPDPKRVEEDLVVSVPARLKRTGMEMRLLINGGKPAGKPDPSLVRLIAQAHQLREIFCRGNATISEMASESGLARSHFTRVLRLGFLAPDITRAILLGRQPPGLTARKLMRGAPIPIAWDEQRQALDLT